jgi:hypothetical protein
VPASSLTADLAQREKRSSRTRCALPRCHRRCDRCCSKAGPTETDSRITDEEARHRSISLQDLIASPGAPAGRAVPPTAATQKDLRALRRSFGECRVRRGVSDVNRSH